MTKSRRNEFVVVCDTSSDLRVPANGENALTAAQMSLCLDCSRMESLKKKKENVLLSRHVTRDTYNCVMVIRDTDWADVLLSAAKPPTKDQEPLLNLMHLIEQNKGKGKETCSHIGAALSNTPGAQ